MEKELIWVNKEFAKRFTELTNEENTKEKQVEALDEYLEKVQKQSKEEFKTSLENLDEDVAIYTGLMLKVKQAFEKAKNEQLNASYALWEKFEDDIPNITKKTESLISKLNPVVDKLKELNTLLLGFPTYQLETFSKIMAHMDCLNPRGKKMIEFLIKNFKNE